MNYDSALIRYGEVALKGPAVRRGFEDRLAHNISDCLERAGLDHELLKIRGRMVLKTPEARAAAEAATKVFGVVSTSSVVTVSSDIQDITGAAIGLARARIKPGTRFSVQTNRANKAFAPRSQEVNAQLGEAIREETGGVVDLRSPSVTIGIDIRDQTYVFDEVLRGPGGLPLGTAGKVVSLFSGGIDSPVATYLMMKRGCHSLLLFFDAAPLSGPEVRARATEVAGVLAEYSCGSGVRLLIAPYAHVLQAIIEKCPRGLTCTLCKRMMTRIAGEVAAREGCVAVVNGSSLGQVCSQTMTNLALTLSASCFPVLMPLIGFDKEETISIAKGIGTYQTSSKSITECAAVPKRPRTGPTEDEVTAAESRLDLEKLIHKSMDGIVEIRLP